jgi:hypothetical protein
MFVSKEAMKLGASMIQTDIPTSVSGDVEIQDNQAAHDLAKAELEKEGYNVIIDL